MKKITIYTTATCGYCHMLKSYLKDKGAQFDEKRVDQDQKYAQELVEMSNQMGVPFSIVEEDGKDPVGILGFNKSQFDSVLA
jgi:glutaredoxin 3